MSKTPEGKVKEEIDKYLNSIGAFYRKPVVTGYGPRLLDYVGCHNGRFFVIEAKREGGKPTAQQIRMMVDVYKAGGIAVLATCARDVDIAFDVALGHDCPWINPELHIWLHDE